MWPFSELHVVSEALLWGGCGRPHVPHKWPLGSRVCWGSCVFFPTILHIPAFLRQIMVGAIQKHVWSWPFILLALDRQELHAASLCLIHVPEKGVHFAGRLGSQLS